ncbi:MAG TPA: DUF3095 domain-containing protein [Chitinophagaceae bacterium]|nr:DUF3095 domain-containing protein [Chitinophagaceae bacterium]
MSAQINTEQFYSRLPVNEIPLSELLMEEHLFYSVPSNWHVIITDVKKSTSAVNEGLHETVNLVATGSIVAVLNIAFNAGITVPFFFGGDGATFIIPPVILEKVTKALILHQQNTENNFGLLLRVGHIPVEMLYEEGEKLQISKLKTSDIFSIPVVIGTGLSQAEKLIKGEDYKLNVDISGNDLLDLSGMQCRWDKIRPPVNVDEVVSLIVVAGKKLDQAQTFKKVIEKLDEIYGDFEIRKPISLPALKIKGTLQKISNEMKVKLGKYNLIYLLGNWFKSSLAPLYFKTKTGKNYLTQLVALSDTLVIDGKINTVISGTKDQRIKLQEVLNQMEMQGEIYYGLHVSKESVLSCYVKSLQERHIHFVDGAEGGYTRAAIELKKKLVTKK